MSKRRAFTIIELLVVTIIIAILAAIMLPVFASVRGEAKKSVCISNHRQAQVAMMLYLSDYDDRFPPPDYDMNITNSRIDRTWVQLVFPYLKSFRVFNDPADYGPRPAAEATFDEDLVPGDTASQYYQASMRSNIGYNYLYLATPIKTPSNTWEVQSKSLSEIGDHTLLYVDTVYGRDAAGSPVGGGSYLVIPPCRLAGTLQGKVDTFTGLVVPNDPVTVYAAHAGWDETPNSPFEFGLAWPFHNTKMTIMRVDGHASTATTFNLSDGCNVDTGWSGLIRDASRYLWSPTGY
ncbi:MAG: type II secretion system protein [Armatimonadetes bacterium]|nr:type II secretion system protein [Armatimonadota bacterium]